MVVAVSYQSYAAHLHVTTMVCTLTTRAVIIQDYICRNLLERLTIINSITSKPPRMTTNHVYASMLYLLL